MNQTENSRRWAKYYKAVAKSLPHNTLNKAITLFEQTQTNKNKRLAIDLGCGAGRDTFELLRHGWQVLAIDNQPKALGYLQ